MYFVSTIVSYGLARQVIVIEVQKVRAFDRKIRTVSERSGHWCSRHALDHHHHGHSHHHHHHHQHTSYSSTPPPAGVRWNKLAYCRTLRPNYNPEACSLVINAATIPLSGRRREEVGGTWYFFKIRVMCENANSNNRNGGEGEGRGGGRSSRPLHACLPYRQCR